MERQSKKIGGNRSEIVGMDDKSSASIKPE